MTSAKDDDCAECNAKAQPARIELTPAPPTAGAGSAAWEAAAAANGALLDVLSQVCADVSTVLLRLDDKPAAALRGALGEFAGTTAVLASPASPLPEALREQAATLLKRTLRRELIDEA